MPFAKYASEGHYSGEKKTTLVTQGVHNDFHLPVMESIKRTTNQLAITHRAINSLVSTD